MRKLFIVLLSVAAMGAMFFWFREYSATSPKQMTQKERLPETTHQSQQPQSSSPIDLPSTPEIASLPPEGKKKLRAMLEAGQRLNVPISFYGKVVDQDKQPVVNANITATISSFDSSIVYNLNRRDENKYTTLELTTDTSGQFVLGDANGRVLKIDSITKDGYRLDPSAQKTFLFSGATSIHRPNGATPVIFNMWKEGSAEHLVKGKASYSLGTEGGTFTIDLLTKQISPGEKDGDLRVHLKKGANGQSRYPWSFLIESINGGLVETNDPFMFSAPENGYLPRYEFIKNSNDPMWSPDVSKKFYLKSRNGKMFAAIQITAFSNSEPNVLNIEYLANPAGSRNLEFDPQKSIKP